VKITSRFDGRTLYECDADALLATLRSAIDARADLSGANLCEANLSGADLSRADLYRADLYRANLSRADLSGANLSGANLSGANLSGANLSGANLCEANLSGADLSRARIQWQSHSIIAEILRRAAGDDVRQRQIAGLVLISRDWCWQRFLAADIDPDLRTWALAELRLWVRDGDNAPEILRAAGPPREDGQ